MLVSVDHQKNKNKNCYYPSKKKNPSNKQKKRGRKFEKEFGMDSEIKYLAGEKSQGNGKNNETITPAKLCKSGYIYI